MTNYCGYMGRVLMLDLSTRTAKDYPWSDRDREQYIGGKAMASKILYDNLTGTEDPLGPENIVVIATGPITGTGAPSSNRFDISALSPLTGITASSNCGGNFGHYLKKAGFDALILRGACDAPTWVEIEENEIRFHDAAPYWGMRVTEVQDALQKALDAGHEKKVKCGMVVIGPAGENLVRYASVMSGERAAGRAGMGAVFGSKNLKGITVTGKHMAKVFDQEKTNAQRKKWIQYVRSHPITGDRLPRMGTASLLTPMQQHSALMTHNAAEGTFEGYEKISGEAMEAYQEGNNGCLTCPIRCSRRVPHEGRFIKGPELETLGLFGSQLLNDDLEQICLWNYEIDELGMDTISCGGTIAWAMEANKEGIWSCGLNFGETEGISQVLEDIAFRRGIGAELAEGSKRLSEKYGGTDFAIHSKGLELSAYEPRSAFGQGLGYAVSNRGGCHLNGGYLMAVEGLGMDVKGRTPRSKADLCMTMQDLMESISMGGQCLFTSFSVFPPFLVKENKGLFARAIDKVVPFVGPFVRILNKVPEIAFFQIPLIPYTYELNNTVGMKMNIGRFIRNGERSYNVERAVNARFGVSAENDKLPKRLTDVPQDPKDPKSKVPLEKMKKVYYRARGWEKNGLPSEKKLRRLGIEPGSGVNEKTRSGANMIKKAYYRTFQAVFNIGARFLYWRRPIQVSGVGSAEKIPEILKKEKVTKALIVTGPSVGKKLAPIVTAALDKAGIPWVMFAEVEANPRVSTVEKARAMYLDNGCDGFIAIGGGSPMDCAKAAAARVVRPRTSVGKMGGLLRVMKKLPPFVAVPTTAGTGSETTIAAVITDDETHHKYALMDLHLVPKYAVLDPEMTRGLPPKITAATGMDALTHAVEAYVCWTYNTKESLRCAEEATVAIFKYLERAYRDGNDMEARTEMLVASFKAGFAFTRAGVGNVHAIAHTLGGLYNTPHGLANAVILPIVLEDYGAAVYPRLSRLAELTGVCTSGTQQEKAEAFIKEIRAMNQRMEIPTGFDHIQEKDIPQMITWALKEANPVYPVPVVYDRARCEKVIRRIIAEA